MTVPSFGRRDKDAGRLPFSSRRWRRMTVPGFGRRDKDAGRLRVFFEEVARA